MSPASIDPVLPSGTRVLLLLRDTHGATPRWARRALVPVTVAPGLAWTVVVPAGPTLTAAPYDDPLAVFGGVPVPRRLRPAACLVVTRDRLAVQIQGPSWQAPRRWLVWAKGIGLSRYESLTSATPAMVGRLLAPTSTGTVRLVESLRRDSREPAQVADDILAALELPGVGVLTGRVDPATLPGALRIDPSPSRAERFDDRARDELAARTDRREHP